MDYVTNYPLYRVLHNKEQFDVGNIVSEHLEVGDVTRVLQEPGGLSDHELVWVGERHPVLRHEKQTNIDVINSIGLSLCKPESLSGGTPPGPRTCSPPNHTLDSPPGMIR